MVALRAKQVDEWAADFLHHNPDATVPHLACGLDSRAFRLDLPAGVRWFDVDLPDVMHLRRQLYEEAHGYRMIAASVTDGAWLADIRRPAGVGHRRRSADVQELPADLSRRVLNIRSPAAHPTDTRTAGR